jgi:uncharacterized protein (DUF362 family)
MKDMFDPEFLSAEDIERACGVFTAELERREFLRKAGAWAGGLLLAGGLGALAGCGGKTGLSKKAVPGTAPAASTAPAPPAAVDLAVATGQGPGQIARKAVDALGGMGRFVKPGNVVVVKPNASFMAPPESATSTHPEVVGQVVTMCREAGASKVIVMDHCLRGSPQACLTGNGIGAAARQAGAEVIAYDGGDRGHGVDAAVPGGVNLKQVSVYPEVLSADVVITVPRAKQHGSAGLSLGMKNFIGVVTNMSTMHNHDLHQAIADLNTLVKPKLSVIDASVILLGNGPGGPGPTRNANTVIASGDVVAADSYACTLFGMSASDVPYIVYGNRAGLGEVDFNKLSIARV